jgi:hypothetical protein
MVSETLAQGFRATNSSQVSFAMFSDQNPMMQPVKGLADSVRGARHAISPDNSWLAMEQAVSSWITSSLQTYGEMRDAMMEAVFLNTYGSPVLQALVGLSAQEAESLRRIERDVLREVAEAELRSKLEHRFEEGGLQDAVMRAIIYVRLPEGRVDERGFAMLKLIRASRPASKRLSLIRFKEVVKDQFLLVSLDEERAVNALPKLLPADETERQDALDAVERVLSATGPLSEDAKSRLARLKAAFGVKSKNPRLPAAADA